MVRIKGIGLLFFLLKLCCINAQRIPVNGQLKAAYEVGDIHVLNKTAATYAISNDDGSFTIEVQASDTLYISSLAYKNVTYPITPLNVAAREINIVLEEDVNELKEVVIGNMLSGRLASDLKNSEATAQLNFYDLGIPGYIGKPLTANQRRLRDADGGESVQIMGGPFGGGLGLNLHKLLNTISGRTKKLKAHVLLDEKEACMKRLRSNYDEYIPEIAQIEEKFKNEFYLFCTEDDRFVNICRKQNDLEAIAYIKEKFKIYQNRRLANQE